MFPFIDLVGGLSTTQIKWRDGIREPLYLYNELKIYNFNNRQISGSISVTAGGDMDIYAHDDIRLRPTDDVHIFYGTETTAYATFDGVSKALVLHNQTKIAFDGDSTNTYIAANTGETEDLEIHADDDIRLMPDDDVHIFVGSTTNYATFDGSLQALHMKNQSKIIFDSEQTYIAASADPIEDLEIHADDDIKLMPDDDVHIFSGNTQYASFDGGLQALYMFNQSKIIFDSTGTYIAANTEDPEDLEIHADDDIRLIPDDDVHIYHTNTDNHYARFAGTERQLRLFQDIDAEHTPLVLINQSDSNNTNGKVSLQFDLEDTSGNAVDSGKILVGKEQSFTSTGATQNSFMEFHTSLNGTLASKMTLSSGGNLGIGTTAPGAKLHIFNDLAAPDDLGDFDNYQIVIQGGQATNKTAGIMLTTSLDGNGGSSIVHVDNGSNGRGDLVFYTKQSTSVDQAPVEVMRLSSSGDIHVKDQSKIIFDSTDTYIAANADETEDLEIHANDDIRLMPDDDVHIFFGSTTNYARFAGDERQLRLFHDIDAEYTPLILINESDSDNTNGKVSIRFDLEDTSGNAVDSGKILVGKEESFTNISTTQNSSMEFHLSREGTLASKMTLSSAGHLKLPNHPAFNARLTQDVLASDMRNNAGEGALNRSLIVPFNATRFDNGDNFNNSTFIFKAPVTGKYLLTTSINLINIDYNAEFIVVDIFTSNKTYRMGIIGRTETIFKGPDTGDIKYWCFSGSVLADMDVDDSAYVILRQFTGAYGDLKVQTMSHFSGFLTAM